MTPDRREVPIRPHKLVPAMNLFLQYIFAKLGMTYIDFLKHSQFEGVA